MSPMTVGQRDTEKRWTDSGAYTRAALYVVGVIAVVFVLLAFFIAGGGDNRGLAIAVPAVFLAGGLGALALGVRDFRRGRQWVTWQGAAWFLLALMLVALIMPFAAW